MAKKRPAVQTTLVTPRDTGRELAVQAAQLSIQTRADPNNPTTYGPYDSFAYFNLFERYRRITDVPPYTTLYGTPFGQYARDRALRRLWTQHGAEPITAAISAYVQKVQSADWVLEGPQELARDVHYLLHGADFGQGLEEFIARCVIDWLTQDNGMFVELIGDGDPSGPLEGPVVGISHLDASRCTRTGDIDHPVVYRALTGEIHKIHATRVIFQSDLPSPDERRRGVGFCALSRCVASAQSLINWSEMRNEMIDDMPPTGILAITGINRAAFNEQYQRFMADRAAKEQEVYKGLITLFNVGQPIDMKMQPFRETWEGFTQETLYDVMYDLVSMAFDIDRQEIAPLSSRSNLGSGQQSDVLNQKSRGKGIGSLMSLFERIFNALTPEAVTFKFKLADDTQEKLQVEVKQMKANYITSLYAAGSKPLSSHTIGGTPQIQPTMSTAPQGLIDRREARYMLLREGVLPRELMAADEMNDPDFGIFDDITAKAAKRYGKVIEMTKAGKAYVPMKYQPPKPEGVLKELLNV